MFLSYTPQVLLNRLILIPGLSLALLGAANAEPQQPNKTVELALQAKPDTGQGQMLYLTCAVCHTPEGWGSPSGHYPQIAGQHQSVILKQLADIHLGNRDNPTMAPFADAVFAKGPQALADLSAYIEQLPMVPNNSVGNSFADQEGKRLYDKNCKKCHGSNGEGKAEKHYPRIHGQHYQYLLRQLRWMKTGRRRNADDKMLEQLQSFTRSDMRTVANYISRMRPDKELLSNHKDWRNPDFRSDFVSTPRTHFTPND